MADFEKKLGYTAGGADPEDIKTKGFQAGYKPPASFFNWLFTRISDCIDDLQTYCLKRKIEGYTAFNQIGISAGSETIESIVANVPDNSTLLAVIGEDNARIYPTVYGVLIVTKKDSSRTILEFYEKSYARKWYGMYDSSRTTDKWTGWFKNTTEADLTDFTSHIQNKNNPHSVTKAQVGLGNVPNVTTNDQTPTYSDTTTLATLVSGEKLNVSLQKIKYAITRLIEHINTHKMQTYLSFSDIGLTIGSETIEGIASNIPDNSTLFVIVGADGAAIYPTQYGTLYVMKKNASRVFFEFMEKTTPNRYIGVYDNTMSTPWSGWLNIATADDLNKYLPLSGGTMDINSIIYTCGGYGRIYSSEGMFQVEAWNEAGNEANRRLLSVYNSGQKAMKEALMFVDRVNSDNKYYSVFGQHNKPTGSYTGNGSSAKRTISTGGVGNVLFIWANSDGDALSSNQQTKIYVLPTGAVAFGNDNASDRGVTSAEVMYQDGVLILNTDLNWFNQSGKTYYYQCL